MSEPRIVLHIGAPKTGSSAVRRLLSTNIAVLRERGYVVPSADLQITQRSPGGQTFYLAQVLRDPKGEQPEFNKRMHRLLEDAASEDLNVVISAENLAFNPGAPKLFADVAASYETQVVLYVRRQDDLLVSAWQQWEIKRSRDFWAWIIRSLGTAGDWRAVLTRWETCVPAEAISVRVHERGSLAGGDVVTDFLATAMPEIDISDLVRKTIPINPSITGSICRQNEGNTEIFRNSDDNGFFRMVEDLTGSRYHQRTSESRLTSQERLAIMDHYRSINGWVKDRYLPDRVGGLFEEVPDGDQGNVSPESELREQLEFLTTSLYALYRRTKQPS